jgi:hypothetical protein
MKVQTAALGLRVKSGWAAAVLLRGPASSPRLGDVRRIDLSDPRFPETRQPYHAAMGKLEMETRKVNRRIDAVRRIAKKSITTLLARYRGKRYTVKSASLVVGSQIDPDSIANPHIRAHAFEGQLFRSVIEEALQTHRIRTNILIERDAYRQAAAKLKQSNENVRRVLQNLGRDTEAPLARRTETRRARRVAGALLAIIKAWSSAFRRAPVHATRAA